MYVEVNHFKGHRRVLLRESYREDGKVKKRTIASLGKLSEVETEALKWSLKYKGNLPPALQAEVTISQGKSIGAVWAAYSMARKLGIVDVLGESDLGKLVLWLVIARVVNQGSRLSAVRMGRTHALASLLQVRRGFCEDDLYQALRWASDRQVDMELSLFRRRRKAVHTLFYDVTSSYFEGHDNELGAFGYSRDGKRKKRQVVVGLLCDQEGVPLSVQAYEGCTQDVKTFVDQVSKAANLFGCEQVTFVGDRGMIKSEQIAELASKHYRYITALTVPQIKRGIKEGLFTPQDFTGNYRELTRGSERYIYWRNPDRAKRCEIDRQGRLDDIRSWVARRNEYLRASERRCIDAAKRDLDKYIRKRRASSWVTSVVAERQLSIKVDLEARHEDALLDGCYVWSTTVSRDDLNPAKVVETYRGLSRVEWAFRTSKTGLLEVRPMYVRSEDSTRGHIFITSLACRIALELQRAWRNLDITVEEGLRHLDALSFVDMKYSTGAIIQHVPSPTAEATELLEALSLGVPPTLPANSADVDTRKKLKNER